MLNITHDLVHEADLFLGLVVISKIVFCGLGLGHVRASPQNRENKVGQLT